MRCASSDPCSSMTAPLQQGAREPTRPSLMAPSPASAVASDAPHESEHEDLLGGLGIMGTRALEGVGRAAKNVPPPTARNSSARASAS